ncbi:MAG: DUF4398 domain-containing protein [Methylococcales bacterium]|nr:DUF4398 domain-containing protein [Methylococcales bacterium]
MKKIYYSLTSVLGITVLAGCSGMEPPHEEISRSAYTIKAAEEDGARELAPLELRQAKKTLEKARLALKNEDYEEALNYAKTAELEAQLAQAITESASNNVAAQAIKDSIRSLKRELDRYQIKTQ